MNQKVLASFRVPSLLLAAFLQCMPMVRAALPAMQSASNLLAIVFRWGAAAAALGGVQAVSGASTVITTGDLTATNGVGSTNRLLAAPQSAGWWSATGTPPGISLAGSGSRWNLQGVPTTPGVYSVALVAKSSASASSKETTSKTITFTVVSGGGSGGGNSPPVAAAQSITTAEDVAKAIALTGSDPNSNPITYTIVAAPAHGALSGVAPNVTYTPAANYNGSDSFTFKVNDGTVDSPAATVSITITAMNDAPVASAQSVTTAESTAKSITLTGSDVDGNPITYAIVTQPAHGALSGVAPGLTYTPTANYNGPDSFTFRVNDGTVNSAAATVSINVTAVNSAPVASAQSVSTAEDTAKPITLAGTDADGNPLAYTVVSPPAHGTLSGTPPGVSYMPAANYNGSDSFTFKANDGITDSAPAPVSIAVSAVNDAPVAIAQSVATDKNVARAITLGGTDVEGDVLTYTVVTPPTKGVLSGNAPNLTYSPNNNATGADSFTFRANDGALNSAVATVSISIVAGSNTAPLAAAQSVTTAEDTARAVTLGGSDADGDPLTFVVTTAPVHGTLGGTAPNLTYTPTASFNGADSFAFKVNDGTADSAAAAVPITVTAVNDAPVANAQSLSASQDTAKTITLSGTDVDGDALSYSITTPPANGSLGGTPPNLVYTPAAGFKGADSFAFKVNDSVADSPSATVAINVTAVNHAPVAGVQSVTAVEDTAKAITLQATDPDGDTLTFVVTSAPAHGTLSGSAPNLTYLPSANYSGTDSFAFKVNDGKVDSSPAVISLAVSSVNDTPTLGALANLNVTKTTVAQSVPLSGISAGPGESQPLQVTATSSNPNVIPTPAVNYASPATTGSLILAPAQDASGSAVITVTVNDGQAENGTVSRSFTVTVEAVTSPVTIDPIPDMTIASAVTQQTVPLTGIGTTAPASAAPLNAGLTAFMQQLLSRLGGRSTGTPIVVTAVSSDTGLIPTPIVYYTSPNTTGTLRFAPVAQRSGVATLSVIVADGRNTPVTRSFQVTVTNQAPDPVNDGPPTIVLTAPAPNSSYSAPAAIHVAATVNANGHSISKVQFFAGPTLVAEDATLPYSADWDCQNTGTCSLVARALFESNGFVDSSPVTVSVTDLPAPWEDMDIGDVSLPGSVTTAPGRIDIEGAGVLGAASDSFHFLYQPLSADGEIKILVKSAGAPGSDARLGVMIRENLTPNSACAFVGVSPDGMLHWQVRDRTGATAVDGPVQGATSTLWLRLTRRGQLLCGFQSANGVSWTPIGLRAIPMASNIHIGLAVASGDDGVRNASSFGIPTVVP